MGWARCSCAFSLTRRAPQALLGVQGPSSPLSHVTGSLCCQQRFRMPYFGVGAFPSLLHLRQHFCWACSGAAPEFLARFPSSPHLEHLRRARVQGKHPSSDSTGLGSPTPWCNRLSTSLVKHSQPFPSTVPGGDKASHMTSTRSRASTFPFPRQRLCVGRLPRQQHLRRGENLIFITWVLWDG